MDCCYGAVLTINFLGKQRETAETGTRVTKGGTPGGGGRGVTVRLHANNEPTLSPTALPWAVVKAKRGMSMKVCVCACLCVCE